MSSERVTIEISDGIADVRFNRPDKRNALDGEQFQAITAAGERLKSEPGVQVVVVSGEGASFCAGLDTSMFADLGGGDGGGIAAVDGGITHRAQQICWVWQEISVPVIMAVHGHALGGGLQIALGGDIRYATPDSKWSVREIHWGIVPDMTGTFMLSRLVRNDIARQLSMTGEIIDGATAHDYGLVTHLADDPRAAAFELATQITARNPDAVRGVKRLYQHLFNQDVADQFALEREVIGSLIGTPNQVEAVMSNLEQRPPSFTE